MIPADIRLHTAFVVYRMFQRIQSLNLCLAEMMHNNRCENCLFPNAAHRPCLSSNAAHEASLSTRSAFSAALSPRAAHPAALFPGAARLAVFIWMPLIQLLSLAVLIQLLCLAMPLFQLFPFTMWPIHLSFFFMWRTVLFCAYHCFK